MWLLRWLKWLAVGIIWWEIVTWYLKDKKFKNELDTAKWVDKVKTIGRYLYNTNKDIATDIKIEVENFDIEETKQNISQIKQNVNDIKSNLLSKLHDIEEQVGSYYSNIKKNNLDWLKSSDKYREIASKISLYTKSLTRYIEDGMITIDDKLNLETKIAEISKKLKSAKK